MKKWNYMFRPLILLCLLCALVMPAGAVQANQGLSDAGVRQISVLPSTAAPQAATDVNKLLQFTSGGHVLGFGIDAVYLAGTDHALRLEFSGGSPVQPIATAGSAPHNIVAPLGSVSYSNAWKNIDVIYSAAEGSIAESTYVIRPGGILRISACTTTLLWP